MRIAVTTDSCEVLDQIDVDTEIGDLTKPMAWAELKARIMDCFNDAKKKEQSCQPK